MFMRKNNDDEHDEKGQKGSRRMKVANGGEKKNGNSNHEIFHITERYVTYLFFERPFAIFPCDVVDSFHLNAHYLTI